MPTEPRVRLANSGMTDFFLRQSQIQRSTVFIDSTRLSGKWRRSNPSDGSKSGEVLDRQAEAGRQSHFQRLFQGDAGACAPVNAPGLQSPASEDICWALSKTPLRKAVPRHMAPGVSWRAAAEEVCPTVLSAVCTAWSTFEVPQPWKDGWLVLAQKPQKPGRDPSDYRPLCLQDPCGKAMILWMEEISHRFYNADFLQPRTPFLTLALKASRNKFVPMTEILHRLRQNSCQC